MHIGIDARFYGPLGKGLGRYTQKLIKNLEKIDSEHKYFIFLSRENFDDYRPQNKNFEKVLAPYKWYTFSEQIRLPRLLNKYNLDLVHFPHFNVPLFYRRKFIVTIHDLILIHFPTLRGTTLNPLFYWLKFLAYKLVINSAIKRADKIIAVSEFTKKDILDNYRLKKEKIIVTYEATDSKTEVLSQNSSEILKKYGILKPYLLYVGNAYPHKNLESLVAAFFEVYKENKNLYLVLVGKEDYFYQELKKYALRLKIPNLIFAKDISDSDLSVLYANAELFVFPSLYEGFGLPPLEAMAEGIPVASSDKSCLKEILGESAYYFNARDKKEIAKTIINLINNKGLRNNLIQKGFTQVKKYSWEKMTRETLEIYNS